ncbi:hypothetical protein PINS_up015515 [Pythium insidiosum]|nr:hypothetical protein PINS_up015515 [Pythium insidiosum]
MTHSMDVSWLAAGTSRGFICLWDLRFLVLIRIWRHSSLRSIHRLKPCLGLPNTLALEEASVPLVFSQQGMEKSQSSISASAHAAQYSEHYTCKRQMRMRVVVQRCSTYRSRIVIDLFSAASSNLRHRCSL